ncbi:MAG: mechanosensitive ion channel family protein [Endomicrobiales bacterium]|nr:mechanosensitive ion channel family protein [Endomicrobiales bacterium]
MDYLLKSMQMFWRPAVLLAGSVVSGLILHYVLYAVLKKFSRKTENVLDDAMIKYSRRPARFIVPLLAVNFVMPVLGLEPSLGAALGRVVSVCWILSFAWLVMQVPDVLKVFIAAKYNINDKDNLEARKIFTQFQVFNRIVVFIVSVLSLGIILMTFDKVRHLGASILASAGIIGLAAGFAGQKIIANLFAGVQLAITQPIRLDDVVIVENEWGWIEDITLTYVVVKIWDLRRMVLPISYFIEKPFQNWTRKTSDILGTVFIYLDYTVPVQAVRDELRRILEGSRLWNGKAWGLQVTNADARSVELRALMSTNDSPSAWDLRCDVREKLIGFLQKNYPDSLPRQRIEMGKR